MAKDFKDVTAALREQGWKLERLLSGHYRAQPPDPKQPLVHLKIGGNEARTLANTIAQLRRSGFEWPPPGKRSASEHEQGVMGMPSDEELAAERLRRGGVPEPAASSPEPVQFDNLPPPAETPEEKMDRLYRDLKEARGYLDLAEQHMAEKNAVKHAAIRAAGEAHDEAEAARLRLLSAKAAFDAAFALEGKAA